MVRRLAKPPRASARRAHGAPTASPPDGANASFLVFFSSRHIHHQLYSSPTYHTARFSRRVPHLHPAQTLTRAVINTTRRCQYRCRCRRR